MARLQGKNILIIIPKDYYAEEEFDPLLPVLKEEGANVLVASQKLKLAVGMKSGRYMPDLLVVDSIEGITGDSYVTGGRGTRQVKGVFHGVVLIGGSGARKYIWNDKLVRLLIVDRYKSGMVVGALGTAVPTLCNAGMTGQLEISAARDKKTLQELDKTNTHVSDNPVSVENRIITAEGGAHVEQFAETFIQEVAKTPVK
ncbi:MAG: hypothetical protein COV67_05035 [Nitrospinae bacterium CG11_big_fil_rev_8_21_14_0_20_56_8]|nr:MAG: hypothetical protein COV67_05035 [Nitrospinae bacterium CG11_big_fil_rev_8_21_14_0_20_56_8]